MKRRVAAAAAIMALSLTLGACSSGDIVAQSGTAADAQSLPNLDAERVSRVVDEVSTLVASADEAGDAERLTKRLDGAALLTRQDQYKLAQATGQALAPLDMTPQVLTVTRGQEWPRSLVDISQAGDSGLPEIYWMVQEDARAPYKMVGWVRLLGGTSLTASSIDVGADAVPSDASGFLKSPKDALSAYVDMLNSGMAGNDDFTVDEFTTTYLADTQALNDSVQAAGSVTAQAQVSDYPVYGITLQDGSALVIGSFTYDHVYHRTVARSKMTLGGTAAAMNDGDDSVIGTVTVRHIATVALTIPPAATGGKMSVVGASRAVDSTSRDDGAKPEGE